MRAFSCPERRGSRPRRSWGARPPPPSGPPPWPAPRCPAGTSPASRGGRPLPRAGAGVTALLVARAGMPSQTPAAATHGAEASSAGPESTRLLGIAAVVGALGLGLEVLWIRLFAQVLHNSVYSFTAVTIAFLLAI